MKSTVGSRIERAEEWNTKRWLSPSTIQWVGWCGKIVIGEGALMHFTASDLTNCNVKKSESEKYAYQRKWKWMNLWVLCFPQQPWEPFGVPPPGPGQVPLGHSGPAWQKMWREAKSWRSLMPRNARNDSTVFLNSTWRFFDVNYMKADCPCRPVNLINLNETVYCKLIVIQIGLRKETFSFTLSRAKFSFLIQVLKSKLGWQLLLLMRWITTGSKCKSKKDPGQEFLAVSCWVFNRKCEVGKEGEGRAWVMLGMAVSAFSSVWAPAQEPLSWTDQVCD